MHVRRVGSAQELREYVRLGGLRDAWRQLLSYALRENINSPASERASSRAPKVLPSKGPIRELVQLAHEELSEMFAQPTP